MSVYVCVTDSKASEKWAGPLRPYSGRGEQLYDEGKEESPGNILFTHWKEMEIMKVHAPKYSWVYKGKATEI